MTPFSELYSKYYTLVSHILQLAHEKPLSLEDLRTYITEEGFLETPTALIPPLTSQDEESYHLLLKEENTFTSILKNKPPVLLTQLEARFLKTLLQDPKLGLFLEDEDFYLLKKALSEFEPLYTQEMIGFARQNPQDDLYQDAHYKKLFKTLTLALQGNQLVELKLDDSAESTLIIAPYKIEYAIREDAFSLLAITLENEQLLDLKRIPLTSIQSIQVLHEAPARNTLVDFAKSCKCKEPLVFEVNNMRSGFERTFMYLSPYERITEYNEEGDTCLVQLYYYPFDESALIDMLISFGPIIKILAPSHIRQCFKTRISKQAQLFANFFTR